MDSCDNNSQALRGPTWYGYLYSHMTIIHLLPLIIIY